MQAIQLDRRFRLIRKDHHLEDAPWGTSPLFDGSVGWEDILTHKRVVLLAEAGSGKTTELKAKAAQLSASGELAFFVPLSAVARDGIRTPLSSTDKKRFDEWRVSDRIAYFFIDSVDEAKDANVRLEDALIKISDSIEDCEGRCSIILSGRYTDWEFDNDFENMSRYLRVPEVGPLLEDVDPNEALKRALDEQGNFFGDDSEAMEETDEDTDVTKVAIMLPLDQSRVEKFLVGSGTQDVQSFIKALTQGNLWSFARRPLDLKWLEGFWRTNDRMGSLHEMISLSIDEKTREPDEFRSRKDDLDSLAATCGIERIAAALVLTGKSDIAITATGKGPNAIEIAKILPDWSAKNRSKLLSRPIFDPATYGRTRLANDNEGLVRDFLCARWLRMRVSSLWPTKSLLALLFGTSYGQDVVRPSMRGTAAWLAISEKDIARELLNRDVNLLLNAGDPGSLSLELKEQILSKLVEKVATASDRKGFTESNIRRFAIPELAPCIHTLWYNNRNSMAVREILLMVIWVGNLKNCLDIVEDSLEFVTHKYGMLFAGRSILSFGCQSARENYSKTLVGSLEKISNIVLWEGLESLFPNPLRIDDFLKILEKKQIDDHESGWGIGKHGKIVAMKIKDLPSITQILSKIVKRNDYDPIEESKESGFIQFIIACLHQALSLADPDDLPNEVIDMALILQGKKLGDVQRSRESYLTLMHRTPSRRRKLLWYISERLKTQSQFHQQSFDKLSIICAQGIPIGLTFWDVDWLILDLSLKTASSDKRLIASSLISIWQNNARDEGLLSRLKDLSSTERELEVAIQETLKFWAELSDDKESVQEQERFEKQELTEKNARLAGWQTFSKSLRDSPEILDSPVAPLNFKADPYLYGVWELLTSSNRSRRSIKSLQLLSPIIGETAVLKATASFIQYWKLHFPVARVERPAGERYFDYALDQIAILGLHLASATMENWPATLSKIEAKKAIVFATLDLTHFPPWLNSFSTSHPELLTQTLVDLIKKESTSGDENFSSATLMKVARSPLELQELLAPDLWKRFQKNSKLSFKEVNETLSILFNCKINRDQLFQLSIKRFLDESDDNFRARYFNCAFSLFPDLALNFLEKEMSKLNTGRANTFSVLIFSSLFGSRYGSYPVNLDNVTADTLKRFIIMAYNLIRHADDNKRIAGKAYVTNLRDDAQRARTNLLNVLTTRPGEYTYRTLLEFSTITEISKNPNHLKTLAYERAQRDSDIAEWTLADVVAFETAQTLAPRNTKDLCDLCSFDIANLQHDLLNSDFAQGETLKILPHEDDVQNFIANALNQVQQSYSLERESQSVNGKMPDIRIRGIRAKISAPIEIKVVESWSLKQLEEALTDQLCKQYLLDRSSKDGILLLVHQTHRVIGWKNHTGGNMNFKEVLAHLEDMARKISSEREDAFRPQIKSIDVSGCADNRTKNITKTKPKRENPIPV